jgi:stearoyl-CoA desaturase (Delta-9 desaturase)
MTSASESSATKARPVDTKKVHIADTELTLENWHKHVNWLNITLIIGVPLIGLAATAWVPLQFKTAVWAVVYYFCTGLGITAGMTLSFFWNIIIMTTNKIQTNWTAT